MNTIQAILATFFVSMVPVAELRVGVPIGVAAGLNPVLAAVIGVLGNMVPVPFVLLLIQKIINWLKTKPKAEKIVTKLEQKVNKNRAKIDKYGWLGLTLLVAVPIPGTGAYTGSLVAACLEMPKWKSFLAISLGIIIAAIIITLGSVGVKSAITN